MIDADSLLSAYTLLGEAICQAQTELAPDAHDALALELQGKVREGKGAFDAGSPLLLELLTQSAVLIERGLGDEGGAPALVEALRSTRRASAAKRRAIKAREAIAPYIIDGGLRLPNDLATHIIASRDRSLSGRAISFIFSSAIALAWLYWKLFG